jgi:hypothetical protein
LGISFDFTDSDDLIILSQRRSINSHGGSSDGLIQHSIEFLVFFHVVIDRFSSVDHGMSIESVFIKLNGEFMDHNINALNDISFMNILD